MNRNAGIFNDIDLELNNNDQVYYTWTISSKKRTIMREREHSNRLYRENIAFEITAAIFLMHCFIT